MSVVVDVVVILEVVGVGCVIVLCCSEMGFVEVLERRMKRRRRCVGFVLRLLLMLS